MIRRTLPVLVLLALSLTGCPGAAEDPELTGPVEDAAIAGEAEEAEPAKKPAPLSRTLCETVTKSDVGEVTGAEYTRTTSQANFPNIKHCAYWTADDASISITIAFGKTAKERMTSLKRFPDLSDVEGFHDEAVWEGKASGTLGVTAGKRFVEIRVGRPKGDGAAKLEQAKAIADVVFSRYP